MSFCLIAFKSGLFFSVVWADRVKSNVFYALKQPMKKLNYGWRWQGRVGQGGVLKWLTLFKVKIVLKNIKRNILIEIFYIV